VAGREPTQKDSRSIRRSSIVEDLHEGDIHGAFGTIRVSDVNPRRTWRRRLLTLAAIVGPGLIVMVGDNDAGGVSTYAQAGQDFGYSLLWTLLLLIPVLIVNQEMVVRLGAVTGVGYARLIKERFGTFWGWFSVGGIFLLNFLTISTEFIGISLAGAYFGFSPYVVVPLGALVLVAITVSGIFSAAKFSGARSAMNASQNFAASTTSGLPNPAPRISDHATARAPITRRRISVRLCASAMMCRRIARPLIPAA